MSGRRFFIWYWSGGGGGSRFAVNLAQRLALRFSPDRVAVSLRADDPTAADLPSGVRVYRADVTSNRKRPLATLARLYTSRDALYAQIEEAKSDLVIIPMNFATAAPLAVGLPRPFVYFAHDPEPHPGDHGVIMQRLTQRLLLRRARGVAALSRYGATRLAGQKVRARVSVAPLSAVSPPRCDAPPAAAMPMRWLFVGRLIRYKGISLLAEALKRLASRDEWRLTIAGFGPEAKEAASLFAGMRQVETMRFEWLSDDAVEAMIASHDVLLAPYVSATQSGVVSQALAFGRPVAATPVGALAEQIDGGAAGWLATDANPEAFGRCLLQILDRPEDHARKAEVALRTARQHWDSDYWAWLEED